MGQDITLSAADGHELAAYRADPVLPPLGGIVVIQEIFGVNAHIRDLCDRYAEVGYLAIAPALFDRYEKGVDLGYTPDDIAVGREFKAKGNANIDGVLNDVAAAAAAAGEGANKIGITGFCWGGVVTYVAACRLGFHAASCYYGAGIIDYKDEAPKCPTIMHFGRRDQSIPMSEVEAIEDARMESQVYVYDAEHGFHCDMRGQFDPHASAVAGMRTIRLFDEHVSKWQR